MKSSKRYIEQSGLKDATHLKVSVYYTKGGSNIFGGGVIKRGYYLSVSPVTVNENLVRQAMFTGQKYLLMEASRYTEKKFNLAVEMAKDMENKLIAAVVEENKAA